MKKMTKINQYSFLLILTQVFMLLFLAFKMIDVMIPDSLYSYEIMKYSGYEIMTSNVLTKTHQIAMIVFFSLILGMLLCLILSIILKKDWMPYKRGILFLEMIASFFFLIHYNFVGFLFMMLLLISIALCFLQEAHLKKIENKSVMFKNVIFCFSLMILMIIVLVSDTILF